jgi:glycolate oxidase iron-sulfur subunit
MQTELAEFIRHTPEGREAEAILRKCVHCGFCTATCPTYQVLGDDLDSPRGRIYLIKRALEGAEVTGKTRLHLDRCLTCRACETTCPSGVRYGRLADIGRAVVEARTRRTPWDRAKRAVLAWALPRPRVFGAALTIAQALRPVLPAALQRRVPKSEEAPAWPAPRHERRMLVLAGCVQPGIAPGINAAAARVLDHIGISLIEAPGAACCGALRFHLNYQERGRDDMRALIDAWWPMVADGSVEAIVMTASGCGATVKDYVHLLAEDPAYRDKAARISALTRDLAEVIPPDGPRPRRAALGRVAFQSPCTLQHGQQIRGKVEALLAASGYELTTVHDAHLCCGSAGTYSLLQPAIASELRGRKLAALQAGMPACIATANIGCLSHLRAGTDVPVRHWIELLDAAAA